MARAWAEDGVGKWVAYNRETGGLVGRGGLSRLPAADGVTHQIASALAFEELAAEVVVAFTERHNHRSRAVMERLPMGYVGEIRAPGLIEGGRVSTTRRRSRSTPAPPAAEAPGGQGGAEDGREPGTGIAWAPGERPSDRQRRRHPPMATAISISGLVKTFGPTRALDGLELEVRTGEVHGFLGPNGAGKTTTIRVLLGLLRADAGRAELLGGDPWRDAVALHRHLAYVPGDVALWPARARPTTPAPTAGPPPGRSSPPGSSCSG